MAYCLNRELTDSFKEKLKRGEIDPERLSAMTSDERRDFFSKFLGGENAKMVNALFESKLLLKNQKIGMISWAKKTAGMTDVARRDVISKVNRLEKALNPAQEADFLKDLVATKLGANVTMEESIKISRLAKESEALRLETLKDGLSKKAQLEANIKYGESVAEFAEYKNKITPSDKALTTVFQDIPNLPKTLMSTMDVSMYFRQGWGSMTSKEFWKNFANGFKYFGSEAAYKKGVAEILGDPLYNQARSDKLGITGLGSDLSKREEAFQSTLVDSLPVLRGSMRAFVGFLNKVRFDRYKSILKKAELAGEDVRAGSKTSKDIAEHVNNFTGRGNLGKADRYGNVAPIANAWLFSPRKIAATIEMMNPRNFLDPKISKTVRKEHLRQLIGSLSATVGALGFASAMGFDVEKDPRSSDFGKVQVGDSRIDFTGGNATYAHLISRLMTGEKKSSTTGRVSELGVGYKADKGTDLIYKFSKNKMSPIASYFATMLDGVDWEGKPIDKKDETLQRMRPLIISSIMEMSESGTELDKMAMLTLFELFGFGVQTY